MKSKALMLLCLAALMVFMSACSQNEGKSDETTDPVLPETEVLETTAEATTAPEETTASPRPELTPVTAEDIPYFTGGMRRSDYDCGDGVYAKIVNSVFESEYRASKR